MELVADESTKSFEFAVAGLGFGYCGVQMKTDGINTYVMGSSESGGCNAIDTLCTAASDSSFVNTGTCGASLTTFTLPPIGRKLAAKTGGGNWAASAYSASPSGGTVVIDGTSTDSIHIGPTTFTPGAGKI